MPDTVTAPGLLQALSLSLLLLMTSGCAVMSKSDCIEGNWAEAGVSDAERGYTSSARLPSRIRVCARHGATANKIDYLLGYKEGLQRYCRPGKAWYAGSINQTYRGICPGEVEQTFLQHYLAGLHTARREVWHKYHWLESELFDARIRRTRHLKDKPLRQRQEARISRLLNRLDELRATRFQINQKIARWSARLESI